MKTISSLVILSLCTSAWSLATPASAYDSQSSAYAQCAQILAQGVYDTKKYVNDYHAKVVMVNQACQTLSSYSNSDDSRWSQNCDTSSSSSGGSLGVDVPIEDVPVGFDGAYDQSGSNAWCNAANSREAYRRAWVPAYVC